MMDGPFCSLSRLIWNSAPLINTVIVVGCIVMMVACILLGIDSGTPMIPMDTNGTITEEITNERYASICTVSRQQKAQLLPIQLVLTSAVCYKSVPTNKSLVFVIHLDRRQPLPCLVGPCLFYVIAMVTWIPWKTWVRSV